MSWSSCYCWWSCSRSSKVHEKRKGRPALAEAAFKLDKFQEIEKLKHEVVRRTSNRNSKKQWLNNNLNFYIFIDVD